MKTFQLFIAITLLPFFSFSQSYVPFMEDSAWWSVAVKCNKVIISNPCIADAGKDTIICVGLYGLDTIYLGGSPTAQYGTPPYSYTWSCDYWIAGTLHFTAYDFLDDTTTSNPRLVNDVEDSIIFHLTIIDSAGLACSDSVRIRFSSFGYIPDGFDLYMNKGDSISFLGESYIGGGIPPLIYTWVPAYGLSDIHDLSTKLSPDTTTYYSLFAVDFVGCTSATWLMYRVFVTNTSVNDQFNTIDLLNIFPNPITNLITIEVSNLILGYKNEFIIYDLFGNVIKKYPIKSSEQKKIISVTTFPNGIYIAVLKINEKLIYRKKISIIH